MTNKRWFRFSLKALLVVMTAVAIFVGLYAKGFRDRRAAITAIEKLHGSFSYRPSGPEWLRKLFRDEKLFWIPMAVRFSSADPVTDAELQSVIEHLKQFDDLTYLNFHGAEISSAALAMLKPFASQLEALDIRSTRVSDAGIADLKQFPRLTELRLEGSAISTAGVDELRKSLPGCRLDVE